MDGYEWQGSLMKALAHPARLQILEVLRSDGECCVCHIENILGQRQAYISQQLSRLREAGLVVDRREGLNVFYSLVDESISRLLEVTKKSAMDLASTNGVKLNFRQLEHDESCPCTCPNCAAKVDGRARESSKE
ncbi:MAG: ArsR/SmtB family transcription factor [Anaerolineales bacterium]